MPTFILEENSYCCKDLDVTVDTLTAGSATFTASVNTGATGFTNIDSISLTLSPVSGGDLSDTDSSPAGTTPVATSSHSITTTAETWSSTVVVAFTDTTETCILTGPQFVIV